MKERIKKLMILAIIVLLAGIGYILLWHITGEGLPCVFHQITGLYCPGCGTGRMMVSVLSMNLYRAFRYNPAAFIALPFITYYLAATGVAYVKGQSKKIGLVEKIIIIFLFILIIVIGVLRNIPALSFLAPPVL